MQFAARYYDGQSSRAEPVTVHVLQSNELQIQPLALSISFSDIDITPRIGDAARRILLPEGAALESRDNDVIDQLAVLANKQQEGFLHKLESLWAYAATALVTLVVGSYFFVTAGLPAIAHTLAQKVPVSVTEQMVTQVMPELDKYFLEESTLDVEQKEELSSLFNRLVPEQSKHNYKLLFRSSPQMGANAFALPDGTIVLLDGLVELADTPDQLTGILLHEIGHVEHHHGLEGLIKRAGLGALVFAYTGDVALANELVVFIPALLLETGYSRQAETESDSYAIERMQAEGLSLDDFAVMMERLFYSVSWDEDGKVSSESCNRPDDVLIDDEDDESIASTESDEQLEMSDDSHSQSELSAIEGQFSENKKHDQEIHDPKAYDQETEGSQSLGEMIFGYLSTHPPTKERIERIREVALNQKIESVE